MAFASRVVSASGYALLAYLSTQFLQFLYIHFRPSSLSKYGSKHRLYKSDSPTWALVTGASDGLGVAWAHELAASGFNVIIHGRNEAKLNKLKLDVEQKHNVHVRLLVIDAGREPVAFDEASYAAFNKKVHDATAHIPLTILINNIGIIGDWHSMAKTSPDVADDSINIDVRFSVQLNRALLPALTRNTPALILNVSSQCEASPIAYATLYTGAKAFGLAYHLSLRYELGYEKHDIEVLSLLYGFIATSSTGRTDKDAVFGVSTAQSAARAGLDKIGCGYSAVWPVWHHRVLSYILSLLPASMGEFAVAKTMMEQKDKMLSIAAKKR